MRNIIRLKIIWVTLVQFLNLMGFTMPIMRRITSYSCEIYPNSYMSAMLRFCLIS